MAFLSVDFVHEAIDDILASVSTSSHRSPDDKDATLQLRRVVTFEDWNSLSSQTRSSDGDESKYNIALSADMPPFYFGIQIVSTDTDTDTDTDRPENNKLIGFCTFNIAYSTWDGRMLYVDELLDVEAAGDDSLLLYRVLAKIAIQTGCARLIWKQKERPQWNNYTSINPEYLDDWLFLSMDRVAMANFVGSSSPTPTSSSLTVSKREENSTTKMKPLHRPSIEEVIRESLLRTTKSTNCNKAAVKLRLAGPDDTDTIARLVQLLAIYEKEPDSVNVTVKNYLLDGYSTTEPLFYCILADVVTVTDGADDKLTTTTTAAMGLFYFGHSLVDGRFLYLEDLFCDEAFRGKGIGTAIMKQLAHISLALDCCQFIWTALDWNTPALSFYKKIGAKLKDNDVKITRYCGNQLQSFADSTQNQTEK